MADLVLSRVGGMRFNQMLINNQDDIYLVSVERSAITEKVNGKYVDKKITCTIGIYATTVLERRTKQRELLKNIVNQKGRLVFLDDVNLFYDAEVLDEVQVVEDTVFTLLTITFTCNPIMYEFTNDLRDLFVDELLMPLDELDIIVNHYYWNGITTRTVKEITNQGNYITKPVIEIDGMAELVTVQIGGTSFSFSNLVGNIYIDCEKMVVYKMVDTKKVSVLPQFRGGFPYIDVGMNDVTIDGRNMNLALTIDYRNTYIV